MRKGTKSKTVESVDGIGQKRIREVRSPLNFDINLKKDCIVTFIISKNGLRCMNQLVYCGFCAQMLSNLTRFDFF